MPLSFQMNIDKDLSKNDMNLDDYVNTTSYMLLLNWWEMMVSHFGEVHSLFFQVLIDAFSKPKGIVENIIVATGINHYVFVS